VYRIVSRITRDKYTVAKGIEELFKLIATYHSYGAICPSCTMITAKLHNNRLHRKRHRRLVDNAVSLMLTKRQFRCLFCSKAFIHELVQSAGESMIIHIHTPRLELRDIYTSGDGT
jgi:transposase